MTVSDHLDGDAAHLLLRTEAEVRSRASAAGVDPAPALAWRRRLCGGAGSDAWTQYDIDLRDDGAVQTWFDSDLAVTLRRILAEADASEAIYVRKRPAIRLRLEHLSDPGRREVERSLASLAIRDDGITWRAGSYAPELALHGGAHALALSHSFSTADTLATLDFLRSGASGAPEHSVGQLMRVFSLFVEDRWELWDVWTRLAVLRDVPSAPDRWSSCASAPAALAWVVADVDQVLAGSATRDDHLSEVVEALRPAAGDVASGCYGLEVPIREVLPLWAVFHWNRMGFDLAMQRALIALVVTALTPLPSRAPTKPGASS